jgi:hypothetical protein
MVMLFALTGSIDNLAARHAYVVDVGFRTERLYGFLTHSADGFELAEIGNTHVVSGLEAAAAYPLSFALTFDHSAAS